MRRNIISYFKENNIYVFCHYDRLINAHKIFIIITALQTFMTTRAQSENGESAALNRWPELAAEV